MTFLQGYTKRLGSHFAIGMMGLGSLFALSACTSSTDESSTSAITTPSIGEVNNDFGFKVWAVQSTAYASNTPWTHGSSSANTTASFSWSSECKIDSTSTNKDLYCYVDVYEYDLYYNGLNLEYHVPSNMCSYLEVSLPYYYKYPIGNGPAAVSYTTDQTSGAITSPVNYNDSTKTPYCAYDYSKDTTNPGPNCCLGKYGVTQTFTNAPVGATLSSPVVTSNVDWGGTLSSCLGGPALDHQKLSSSGLPAPDLYYVDSAGIHSSYTIASPRSKGLSSNVYASNYFVSTNFSSATASTSLTIPAFNPSVGVTSQSAISTYAGTSNNVSATATGTEAHTPRTAVTQPHYQFTCYDRGREVTARIRVLVRSWDQVSSGIGTATSWSSATGNETTPVPGIPLHDFFVMPDFTSGNFSLPSNTSFGYGFPMSNE